MMLHLDGLAFASLLTFAMMGVVTTALGAGPGRRSDRVGLACVLGGSTVAYISASPWLFLAGWTLSTMPFLWSDDVDPLGPRILLLASTVALAAAFVIEVQGDGARMPTTSFALLTVAALIRQGVFPSHVWVPRAYARGSLPLVHLFLNGHLGIYALIRFGIDLPNGVTGAFDWLEGLGLVSAVYTALLAVVATQPRRVLALLSVSHSAFILTGMVSGNLEGSTGAFVHWSGVSLALTLLVGVFQAVEARTTDVDRPRGFLGLGFHAPRLAVFFAAGVLGLVGLPGTIGFVAEDLLFHGAMEAHAIWGVALPIAALLDAVAAFGLLTRLFLGRRGLHVAAIPDARPAERWLLTVPVVLLVLGGVVPGALIGPRASTASWVVERLAAR